MTVVVSTGGKLVAAPSSRSWPLRGIERPQTLSSSRGLEFDALGWSDTYASLYAGQPWVFALVNKLSRGIARLPAKSYSLDPASGDRERLRAHPLPVLLSRPYPRGSRFRLVEATVGSLAIYGNALWWKYRQGPGKPPVELWPLDWRNITIRTGENAPIAHYEYKASGGKRILLPDEVVHFQWWSPAGLAGTSPLEPLRVTLAIEEAGRRYAVSSFANGVRPSGALVTDRDLNKQKRDELQAAIHAVHQGPDNAFRMMLLTGGMTWQPFSHTAVEAQTIETRKLNQVEVCAVYDIPPPIVAILDNATYANITEQHKMLYQTSIGPWLTMFEETIDAQLLWGEPEFANTYVEFDLSEILRSDIEKRGAAYQRMMHVLTPNEMRALENRGRIEQEEADMIHMPLNSAPVGESVTEDATVV